MTAPHPAFRWLQRALEAGIHLFPLSPGQKRSIPARPVIAVLVDDGTMGAATGPAGFDQATIETLLRNAITSALTTSGPHERIYSAAVALATHNRDGLILIVETAPKFETAWIAFLNSHATLLPPVAVDLSETRQ